MPTCQVCQSDKFTIDAGFSYCDDCGTQAQNFQEVEYEAFFEDEIKLNKTNIKVASAVENGEWMDAGVSGSVNLNWF